MRQSGSPILAMLGDRAGRVRPKAIGLCVVLGVANLLAWLWAFGSFHTYPLLLAALSRMASGCGTRSMRIT
jgi:hypothetical protein